MVMVRSSASASASTAFSPSVFISMVIGVCVMISFGAIIMAQLNGAINQLDIMNESSSSYDANAANTVQTVMSNGWIAFSILAIMVIIVVAYGIIRMF